MGVEAMEIETVRDLMDAAELAGVRPSELIETVEPQRAP